MAFRGKNLASPEPIGSTTPNTIAATTLATSGNIVSSGTIFGDGSGLSNVTSESAWSRDASASEIYPTTTTDNVVVSGSLFGQQIEAIGINSANSAIKLSGNNLTLAGGDITLTTSGNYTYTYPGATTTLVSTDTTQTLSNKTISDNLIVSGTILAQHITATKIDTAGAITSYDFIEANNINIVERATVGSSTPINVTGGVHTDLAAAMEVVGVQFDFSANKTWAAGAGPLATQRELYIKAPTYIGDVGGALTITAAATVYIDAAPTAGANMTLSSSYALWVDAGVSAFGGNIVPDANDVAALGTATLAFSDLFLADGGVINWNNGAATLTHASNGITAGASYFAVTQQAATSGFPTALNVTGGAHTGLTAATEVSGIKFDFSANKTWAAGAGPLANQREIYIKAPTYIGDVGGALTMTDAATVYIDAAPTQGANMTLSNPWALWVAAGNTRFDKRIQVNINDAGKGIGIDNSATAFTNGEATLHINRSGSITGVDAEFLNDVVVAPAFTLTDPGAGSFVYRVMQIDAAGMSVTAAGGATAIELLSLTTSGDTDLDEETAIRINYSSTGIAIDLIATGTDYGDGDALIFIERTGNITGVDAEAMADFGIAPGFTLTEPDSGVFVYAGASIDMSSMSVTAGGGTSLVTALALTASGDGDVGVDLALYVTAGNVALGSGVSLVDGNGLEMVIFTQTGSAVNELTIANAATGNGPSITASGETNVPLTVASKGSSNLNLTPGTTGATVLTAGDFYTTALTNYGGTSTIVGFSAYTYQYIFYKLVGTTCTVYFRIVGTSNATNFTFTLPYTSKNIGIVFGGGLTSTGDNNSALTPAGRCTLSANSNTVIVHSDGASGAWTNSGTKYGYGQFSFEIV